MNDLLFAVKGTGGGDAPPLPPPPRRGGAAGAGGPYDLEEGGGLGTNPAAAGLPGTERARELEGFFAAAEDVKRDLADIRQRQRGIAALHERGKTIVRQKEMRQHQEQMQQAVNEVNVVASRAKAKIEALDRDNELALAKRGQGVGSASERTRTSVTTGLKRKLKDLMGEFGDLRARIHEEYREVVERRVYTVTGQRVDEERLDALIESGEAESIFQRAILDQGRGRVLDTLAEIQERHRAVKGLEQSLMELHQIFLDMAVLVEAQGELLDNVERQVARSVEYVQSGTAALQDAKRLQKNTRKWMCCGVVVLLLVALAIVLAVWRPWQPGALGALGGKPAAPQPQPAAPAPAPPPPPPPPGQR